MGNKNYDFVGYATKNDLKCSDGRVIRRNAFAHQDGDTVPLVWMHGHKDVKNVLGHGILKNVADGVKLFASFNETEEGKAAKAQVKHGDYKSLSIYANKLVEKSKNVMHGHIVEVSLVLKGANPGAVIENVIMAHGDSDTPVYDEEEAVIYTGESLSLDAEENIEHSDEDPTMEEVFETFDEKQKEVVYAMLAAVAGDEMEHSDVEEGEENLEHSDEDDPEGGQEMKKNLFDKTQTQTSKRGVLTHSDIKSIFEAATAKDNKTNLSQIVLSHIDGMDEEAFAHVDYSKDELMHAGTYGIDDIEILFPDAKFVMNTPEFDKRRTEWVSGVLNGTRKVPFMHIKSMYADITEDEARAKGYIKGNEKLEEVFKLFTRSTNGKMIYKKQKLDREDVIQITSFDIVAWLKMEMRLMLDEEIARAILVGDGRTISDPDKIDEDSIRPVWTDEDLYTLKSRHASTVEGIDLLEAIIKAMNSYKGSGKPNFYTTRAIMTDLKLLKDDNGQYRFRTMSEIADFIGVNKIVDVEVMEGLSREHEAKTYDLIGLIVNLRDYTVGSNAGGKLAFFDDFDIDFNQMKYLYETMMSGALTKIKSAISVEREQAAG